MGRYPTWGFTVTVIEPNPPRPHASPPGASGFGRALLLGHNAFQPELAGMAEHHLAVVVLKVLVQPQARTGLVRTGASVALRTPTSRGAGRRRSARSGRRRRGRRWRRRADSGCGRSSACHHSRHTASPSMMQDRERRLASASVISGKRSVRSFAGRLLRGGGQHAGHERDEHDSDAKQVKKKKASMACIPLAAQNLRSGSSRSYCARSQLGGR
jgi:hypothetical protein